MTELECVESGSQGSRRRVRRTSLRLGLLDGLGLVSQTLLVSALSSAVPSATSATSLAITLLLNGGSVLCPYDVNWIPLISDLMPAALLSDPMIRIPLS